MQNNNLDFDEAPYPDQPEHLLYDAEDNMDASIDDAISKLEKILKIEAISDAEWHALNSIEEELQDDIDPLDFQ